MGKVATLKQRGQEESPRLDTTIIDELNLDIGFVRAVLDAVDRIVHTHGDFDINEPTITCLISEAQDRLDKVDKAVNDKL